MRNASLRSVAVLTGAGISAESGVPTFRGADGLWRQYRAEELATPQAFMRNPTLVWEWYDWRRGLIAGCQPNAAHRTLTEMERWCEDFTLITQNVDGLHQRAGSERILELHGDIWRVRCTTDNTVCDNHEVPLSRIPPTCPCGALLRPDVVWFGESLDSEVMNAAYAAVERCDLMLVVGTSAVVHPAASLPAIAHNAGAYLVEVNVQETALSALADEVILGPAARELPELWARLTGAL
ncbi:MAG TPA: NAD-dependent deacylase [Anaerolineae bacterium]|nr:NAD-dependent deacylase [Anaerolineae bacterium]